jgi:HD-GYP domain-containing protein (c-di-GMP phosphodiesterase class II)
MKTHTTKGANILRSVTQLKDMIPGIELHHESLDGRGYPHGLKGDQIPLLARVIAVADTFDALTTNRPYQQAYNPVDALKIIHNLSGKRLDPTAASAITAIFYRGEIQITRPAVTASSPLVSAPISVPPTAIPAVSETRA